MTNINQERVLERLEEILEARRKHLNTYQALTDLRNNIEVGVYDALSIDETKIRLQKRVEALNLSVDWFKTRGGALGFDNIGPMANSFYDFLTKDL